MERVDFSLHRVLVVGPKTHAVQLLRSVMDIAGVSRVVHVEKSRDAIELLASEHFSAVFYEQSVEPVDTVPFALAARRRETMVNPMLPIFALAPRARRRDVEDARDRGVNDVLTTPISPQTIATKLRAAAESPRPFIVAKEFFGPDRRGKGRTAYFGAERRVRSGRKIKMDLTLI
jgi:PleD family two-component response regulator